MGLVARGAQRDLSRVRHKHRLFARYRRIGHNENYSLLTREAR